MHRIRGTVPALAVAGLLGFSTGARAQAPVAPQPEAPKTEAAAAAPSADPIDRIKEEGEKRSQVMATLSTLTDVIGPRLTGSPGLKRANEWTRDQMVRWGMENGHLEAWGPFGRGWTLKRFSAQIVSPQCIPLIAVPKAWSPSLENFTGEVIHFDVKTDADFEKYKGKLKGAVVLTAPAVDVNARFEPLARRQTDSELLNLADAGEPGTGGRRPRPVVAGAPGAPGAPAAPAAPGAPPAAGQPGFPGRQALGDMRAQMELAAKRTRFLAEEGVALLIDPSRNGDGGTLFVQSASVASPAPPPTPGQGGGPGVRRVSAWDKEAKVIPQVTMAKEHYNRLVRMLAAGEKLKLNVDLAVEFQDEDMNSYNTVAEIPGTDLKDEIVMLGGHLDSWHGGTGTTDNAAGCSVAMEAARIIKALDLKPRRTIRVALWTGEEQGIFGSKAYVDEHFRKAPARGGFGGPGGSAPPASEEKEETKPEYEKLSGYFNLDNGTGKIRGVYLQGNEAVRPIFRKWLQPFREMGANTLSLSNTGGTDHLSFDAVGLPGFQFIQDEIEYDTRTHHSNMDVYDRAQADDLKQASIIMAAFVYNTAMMDEKLPRKPARPAQRPDSRATAAGGGQ